MARMEEEEADRGGNVIQCRVRIEREKRFELFLFFLVVDEGMSVQPTVSRGGLDAGSGETTASQTPLH